MIFFVLGGFYILKSLIWRTGDDDVDHHDDKNNNNLVTGT